MSGKNREEATVGAMRASEFEGEQESAKLAGRKCGEGSAPDEECGERDGGAESAFGNIHVRTEVGI